MKEMCGLTQKITGFSIETSCNSFQQSANAPACCAAGYRSIKCRRVDAVGTRDSSKRRWRRQPGRRVGLRGHVQACYCAGLMADLLPVLLFLRLVVGPRRRRHCTAGCAGRRSLRSLIS